MYYLQTYWCWGLQLELSSNFLHVFQRMFDKSLNRLLSGILQSAKDTYLFTLKRCAELKN